MANKRIGNEALLVHIRAIHVEFKQEYGWPKMWKELLARGIRVGKESLRKMRFCCNKGVTGKIAPLPTS